VSGESGRVLLTGATGLIGRAVAAHLIELGYHVVGIARSVTRPALQLPGVEWIALDIAAATRTEDWLPHLAGVDSVVNCAGVLQDSLHDSTDRVHVAGIGALFGACERAGVHRVVHISAIGVDREAPTRFSRSKLVADQALMQRDLDWIVLRPSVVLGAGAYGGSALLRALAASPLLPAIPDSGLLQVVQLDDVVATVGFFLRPAVPTRMVLDLVGPERLSLEEIVRQYRRWLGWSEPRIVTVPRPAMAILCGLGDLTGWLGWRPPLRSTTRREFGRGASGASNQWTEVTGIVPQSLATALARRPAAVQERWFAALYLLKPAVFAGLSLFWLVTGLIALGPGYGDGLALVESAGFGRFGAVAVIAGAITDILVGAGIAIRRTSRLALIASLAVSGGYLLAATLLASRLWGDPLGPLVKILPASLLSLVALAILEDR
jgi:uncharacterized protein YbjT (DUF2867 family)